MRAKPQILIADDDPVFRGVVRATLLGADFDVVEVENGALALAAVRREQPDLVLLDVMMPELDGFETCRSIRALPNGGRLPILIMTALDDLNSIEHAYEAGATDFLEKPPNWGALPRRLQYALRASRTLVELHASRAAAESSSQAKTEFLANVSHEIRTPMAAILGYVELLRDEHVLDGATQTAHQAFEAIERNGAFLLALINDLLETARIEQGQLSIEPEVFDPAALARTSVEAFRELASQKHLELSLTLDPALPARIESDPRRVQQILQNLVANALKFTPAGSVAVRVFAERSAQGASSLGLEVVDTGIGIAASDHERVFEAFEQVDNSRSRSAGGAGLGLAIVQRLVRGLSGTLDLQSELGQGSRFTIRVPVRLREEPATSTAEPATPTAQLQARLLLAEDSRDNQVLLTRIIRKAGAEVVVACDGREALEQLLHSGDVFDLVLMDMQMPRLDGYEATRTARDAGLSMPIIALTAHAMAGEREHCLASGCDDYATKPIRRDELLSLIAYWLDKGRSRGAS